MLIAGSFYTWFNQGEEKYGVDYRGGLALVVRFDAEVQSDTLRQALSGAGFEDAVVQTFDTGKDEYSIRVGRAPGADIGENETQKTQSLVLKVLSEKIGKNPTVLQSDYVGPTIGKELRRKALIAVLCGLIGMLIYITVRFEVAYALGAVVALFHDVIIGMGAYLWTGHTISVSTLAAALTIVGYSVNDTIVVFDRVRDERNHNKHMSLREVFNHSVNVTLSRTIITSALTLFSALALLIFGGGPIEELALFLVAGIIVGSYSTIFIASPVALAWERWRNPAAVLAKKQAA